MNLNPNTEGNVLNDNLARKKDVLIESTENKKEAELNKFSDLVGLIEKQSEIRCKISYSKKCQIAR